jgi:hypothetical protein
MLPSTSPHDALARIGQALLEEDDVGSLPRDVDCSVEEDSGISGLQGRTAVADAVADERITRPFRHKASMMPAFWTGAW